MITNLINVLAPFAIYVLGLGGLAFVMFVTISYNMASYKLWRIPLLLLMLICGSIGFASLSIENAFVFQMPKLSALVCIFIAYTIPFFLYKKMYQLHFSLLIQVVCSFLAIAQIATLIKS